MAGFDVIAVHPDENVEVSIGRVFGSITMNVDSPGDNAKLTFYLTDQAAGAIIKALTNQLVIE